MIKVRCGYPAPCPGCGKGGKKGRTMIVVYEYGSDFEKLRLCRECFERMISDYEKVRVNLT